MGVRDTCHQDSKCKGDTNLIATIIDVETTGLNHPREDMITIDKNLDSYDNIIEVGAMRVDTVTKKILRADNFYFYRPGWDINSTSHIHGITEDFLINHYNEKESTLPGLDLFQENLNKLFTYMVSAPVIGKNSNAFDIPFIKYFIYKNIGIDIDDFPATPGIDVQKTYSPIWQKKTGETRKKGTLTQYIDSIPNGKSIAQQVYKSLGKVEGSRGTEMHTALYDAVCTYVVYCYTEKPW